MATKSKYTGVTPFGSGWQYRIKMKDPNGKVVDTRIRQDADGKPFLRARDAYEAKKAHEERIRTTPPETASEPSVTFLSDVYKSYLETEGRQKAAATLRKQDSMWRNYIEDKFGNRDINSISIVELDSFLLDLYQDHAWKYVEGFLKFFYLLFGHAERMDVFDSKRYNKMFVARSTRLSMPTIEQEEEIKLKSSVSSYTDMELHRIENIFKSEDGNLLMAYYLGLYCGLRISECFALRWSNIDWDKQTLTVERQQHYVDGTVRLTKVKTLTSVRTIIIPDFLFDELTFFYDVQRHTKESMGNSYRDTERVFDEVSKEWIVGGDFINRKKNGELLTVNSMKYWSKKIKKETQIDFHYHALRHTYGTRCAASNMPVHKLMQLLGHKKYDTTQKYYLNTEDPYVVDHTTELLNGLYKNVDQPWGSDEWKFTIKRKEDS